jgi:hypothetical protein
MGNYNNGRHLIFGHTQQDERKKESWELEHPWRENSRACKSVSRAHWS